MKSMNIEVGEMHVVKCVMLKLVCKIRVIHGKTTHTYTRHSSLLLFFTLSFLFFPFYINNRSIITSDKIIGTFAIPCRRYTSTSAMLSASDHLCLEVSTFHHQSRQANSQVYIVRDDGTRFGMT